MADDLNNIVAGDFSPLAFSVSAINQTLEATRAFHRNKGRTGPGLIDQRPLIPSAQINVYNGGTDTIAAFSVLTPTGTVSDPETKNPIEASKRPTITASAPTSAGNLIVITTGPIGPAALGRAVILGVAVVAVEVLDEDHQFAVPIAGDSSKLRSAEEGPVTLLPGAFPSGGASSGSSDDGSTTTRRLVLLGGNGTPGGTSGGGTGPDCCNGEDVSTCGVGCGWVQALETTDCLIASVVSATGRFADTDLGQEQTLTHDTGDEWADADERHIVICGRGYFARFSKGGCNGPCLTLTEDPDFIAPSSSDGGDPCEGVECPPGEVCVEGECLPEVEPLELEEEEDGEGHEDDTDLEGDGPGAIMATRVCCGRNFAEFAVGGSALCPTARAPGGPAANLVKIRVEWVEGACGTVEVACCPGLQVPVNLCVRLTDPNLSTVFGQLVACFPDPIILTHTTEMPDYVPAAHHWAFDFSNPNRKFFFHPPIPYHSCFECMNPDACYLYVVAVIEGCAASVTWFGITDDSVLTAGAGSFISCCPFGFAGADVISSLGGDGSAVAAKATLGLCDGPEECPPCCEDEESPEDLLVFVSNMTGNVADYLPDLFSITKTSALEWQGNAGGSLGASDVVFACGSISGNAQMILNFPDWGGLSLTQTMLVLNCTEFVCVIDYTFSGPGPVGSCRFTIVLDTL